MGIGLVILGVIYVLYSQTVDISDRQLAEAQSLMEASQISRRIGGLIDSACRPEDLANDAAAWAPEQFLPDQLAIYALSTTSGEGPQLYRISNDAQETSRTIMIGSDTVRPHQNLFDTAVKFAYASEFSDRLEPLNLADSAASRPKYIRFTITIRDKREMMRKVLIITSGAALK
jgi:hypothetical protein